MSIPVTITHSRKACSLELISQLTSYNLQYFSLTPNQSTVLLAMTYKPNQPKRMGRWFGPLFIHLSVQF